MEGLAQIQYTHTAEFSYPECSGTHDIGLQYYQANLEGEFYKMPGGEGIFVSFQADPDHGEPYVVQWNLACPGAVVPYDQHEGWRWGGHGGELKDGVYDYYADLSAGGYVNGEFWQKVHMGEGGAE